MTTTTLCACLLAAGAEDRAGRAYEDLAAVKAVDANAQGAVPRIKEAMGKQADEIVKIIETSKTARKMISLEEAKRTQEK